MKKRLGILVSILFICLMTLPTFAADAPPEIVCQPQNPTYNPYAVALYSVTAKGNDLVCTWHLVFDGVDYNISKTDEVFDPWEGYAGEQYGCYAEESAGQTAFYYYFQGIGEELSGAAIYAVIDNGSQSIVSDMAYIYVVDDAKTPPTTVVPASVELYQGEAYTLHCEASVPDGSTLSYLWYSTSTGKIQNIMAVNRGGEDKADLTVDTSTVGTQYYCCMVTSASGGSTYSSLIKVTVTDPPQMQMTDSATIPSGTVGQKYSFDLKQLSEATNYKIYESSTYPNEFEKTGLIIGKNDILSGTPTAAGEYKFAVVGEKSSGTGSYICEIAFIVEVPETTEAPETTKTPETKEPETEKTTETTKTPEIDSPETKKPETDPPYRDNEPDRQMSGVVVALIAVSAGLAGALIVLLFTKNKK